MRIGVDLDNTIIRYDPLFHRIAVERNWIPVSTPLSKTEVKTAIFRKNNNALWTQLQGLVYGTHLSEAQPYPEALEFFKKCRKEGYPTCIISHKTRYPAIGPPQNLHEAALNWLIAQGWLEERLTGLRLQDIEFTDTREAKIAAIKRRNCEVFIDDLPEVLADFPAQTKCYLFDPHNDHPNWLGGTRVKSWRELQQWILGLL